MSCDSDARWTPQRAIRVDFPWNGRNDLSTDKGLTCLDDVVNSAFDADDDESFLEEAADSWSEETSRFAGELERKIPAIDDFTTRRNVEGVMRSFFSGRRFHGGGPIRESDLYSADNIEMLTVMVDEDFAIGVDAIHAFVERNLDDFGPNDKDRNIYMVNELLCECSRKGVPKHFAPGIALLYLEFCVGYKY